MCNEFQPSLKKKKKKKKKKKQTKHKKIKMFAVPVFKKT